MSDPKPLSGWIILDKPRGLGSTQAVSRVKRALREAGEAKTKVGHGGTLDPLAEGVLPIALGEATKLAGRMLDASKIYDFTIAFGTQTDTLDMEGAVIATSDVRPTMAQVEAVLPQFTGPIEQAPPAYSAIKIDGERAYDRARAGEVVDMKLRATTIYALTRHPREGGDPSPAPSTKSDVPEMDSRLRGNDDVKEHLDEVTLTAHVSKGTYIRSLARDIAIALNTVGHVTYLRRVKAGPFTAIQAISLDYLADAATERRVASLVRPLTEGLDDIPALSVTVAQAAALRQGKVLAADPRNSGLMLATQGDVPVALVEASDLGVKVVRGFNL